MQATFSNAVYDPTTGAILVTLDNSNINSYQNQVIQFETANRIAIPQEGQLVNIEEEASTQLQATGYQNSIIDENYIPVVYGESTDYSQNWYYSIRNSGIEIQQAQTTNIENTMMGQSTNAVLLDIMNLLINIIDWLGTHTHEAGTYVADSTPVTGTSGDPVTSPPSDSDVSNDITYITDNKNLTITGTYQPK